MSQKMKQQVEVEEQASLFLRKGHKVPKFSNGKISLRGAVLRSYVLNLVARTLVELAFILGQYFLYGFTLQARYVCIASPCPHQVDCFLSRPTEKSMFIWFMLVVACVSLLLSAVELLQLTLKAMGECMARRQDYTVTPVTPLHHQNHDRFFLERLDNKAQAGGGPNGLARNPAPQDGHVGEVHI